MNCGDGGKPENGMKKVNLVGRQISRLRYQRDMTQDDLATKLQEAGWKTASRSCVSKIESGPIQVPDYRLYYFAHVFQVPTYNLLPQIDVSKSVHDNILWFIRNAKRGLVPSAGNTSKLGSFFS
jgi:transcriptional regulator with XRE-family HTH domain